MAHQAIWPKIEGSLIGSLPTITQGSTLEPITILALYSDGTAVNLTGKAMTATMRDGDDVYSVTGVLTGGNGSFTWKLSAGDIGTAGGYSTIFTYSDGAELWSSDPVWFVIRANPSATAVQNPALVGLSTAEAAWLAAAKTAVDNGANVVDATDLGTAAYEDTGAFDAAGAAAAVTDALDPRIDILEAAMIPVAPVIALTVNTVTITVSWTYTAIAPITGFKLYRKTGIGGTYALIASPASGDTSYANSGLSPSTVYYYRLDAYNSFFTTASNQPTATTESLSFDFTTMADGALPAAFTGATWAVSGGKAINTPATLGSTIVTNGTFATDTGWTKGTGWSIAGTAAHAAGTQSLLAQNCGAVLGTWYRLSWQMLNRTAGGVRPELAGQWSNPYRSADGTYTETLRSYYTSPNTLYLNAQSTFAGELDNVALQALSLPELMATLQPFAADVTIELAVAAIGTGVQVGIVMNLDSITTPLNFIVAFIKDTTIRLEKCVNGVYATTVPITGGITFVANAKIKVVKIGTTYQLYYNNIQVGTDTTISDAGIVSNTIHGLFSTDPTAQIGSFDGI